MIPVKHELTVYPIRPSLVYDDDFLVEAYWWWEDTRAMNTRMVSQIKQEVVKHGMMNEKVFR